MSRYAVVNNGVVENIIIWDGVADIGGIEKNLINIDSVFVDIGSIYKDGFFTSPESDSLE